MSDAAEGCLLTRRLAGRAGGPITFRWYALRVRAQQEFQVADLLKRNWIDPFLPTWSETVQWSDRVKVTQRPLFPGYVFARLADDGCDFPIALQTRGVVQILPSSLQPVAISDAEMDMVQRVVSYKRLGAPCAFVAGEKVIIDSGPLAGVSGVVVRTRGSVRVVVGIEMLQRAISVELDAGTLLKKQGDESNV